MIFNAEDKLGKKLQTYEEKNNSEKINVCEEKKELNQCKPLWAVGFSTLGPADYACGAEEIDTISNTVTN